MELQAAKHLHNTGGDLTEAARRLYRLEALVFGPATLPARADFLRRACLATLWEVSYDLGRFPEARRVAERWRALTEAQGDLYGQAASAYAEAITYTELELPNPRTRSRFRGRVHEALELAVDANHREIEARSRLLLAKLSPEDQGPLHLDRCRSLAGGLGLKELARDCRREEIRAGRDAASAARWLLETEARVEEPEDPWTLLYNWADHLELRWRISSGSDTLDAAETILAAVEDVRQVQDGTGGARFLSVWADAYYWLSGRLLEEDEGLPEGRDLGYRSRAFEVMERLRAQVLRDRLAAAGVETSSLATPATLAQVQAALEPDEAMLSYQLFLWQSWYHRFAGGAWLTVITRDEVRTYRRPGREHLEPALAVYLGLQDPEGHPRAKEDLYRSLLKEPLDELPAGIERLVLIPDGPLHLLPFAALGESGGSPLVDRYELSSAPSAGLWLHWRQARPLTPPVADALILAAPAPPGAAPVSSGKRGGLPAAERLARTPLLHARREGRLIRALAGPESRLLLGQGATPEALELASRPGILHLAAHAVVDPERPERSAILLAGGRPLTPEAIAALDLEGTLVVLSACRSAAGLWLRGEGVLSLARAFFEAGAPAVVATLTPVRDDHAADLVTDLYRHLARGATVQGALAAAQRQAHAQGRPASAWSSLVVLGDGGLRPLLAQDGSRHRWPALAWVGLAVVAGLAVAAVLARRRTRRDGTP